jgi:hypothetical protein
VIGYVLIGWLTSTVVLGAFCQYYKVRAETLAQEVLNAHDWVDEIIVALEAPEGAESQERISGLVAEQRPDGRTGNDEHRVV